MQVLDIKEDFTLRWSLSAYADPCLHDLSAYLLTHTNMHGLPARLHKEDESQGRATARSQHNIKLHVTSRLIVQKQQVYLGATKDTTRPNCGENLPEPGADVAASQHMHNTA